MLINLLGLGLLQAIVASGVLWLWTLFMTNLDRFVQTGTPPTAPTFVLVPIIFVIAATLSAGAVLGYPIYFITQKRWKSAIALTLVTLLWLGILVAVLISLY